MWPFNSTLDLLKQKLRRRNYGTSNRRSSWEVDHSIPQSRGGTNHLNNLFPACIKCNRSKGDLKRKQFSRVMKKEKGESDGDPWSSLVILGSVLCGLWVLSKIFENKKNNTNSYY